MNFYCNFKIMMESDDESEGVNLENSDGGSAISVSSSDSEGESHDQDHIGLDGWTEIDNQTDFPPPSSPFQFVGDSTINADLSSFTAPLQFFNYFFDDALVDRIVKETNLYSIQERAASGRKKEWSVTPSEMRIFLAVLVAMSITHKPEENMYWARKSCVATPFFCRTMSFKKYVLIKKYLHFSNNETYDPAGHPNPKLNKIWPVYESLDGKFRQAYTPKRDVTVTENSILPNRTSSWKRHGGNGPGKRAPLGMRSYFLCESESGYIWSTLIRTGRETNDGGEFSNLTSSSQVIMSLMEPLLNKGHCLTVVNFRTTVKLTDLLTKKRTDSYGNVGSNKRSLPKNINHPKKVHRGCIKAYRKQRAMVMRWKNVKDVYFVSTVHGTETEKINKRSDILGRPKVGLDHNSKIEVVDRIYQNFINYPLRKRGKKYYKKVFFHLMEQALWNSYVLYTKTGGSMTHLDYRIKLIEEYIENYHSPEFSSKGGRPSKAPNPLRLTERHFLRSIPVTGNKTNPTKRCVVCCSKRDASGKRIRRESRYYCPQCDVCLCLESCFETYHTQSVY